MNNLFINEKKTKKPSASFKQMNIRVCWGVVRDLITLGCHLKYSDKINNGNDSHSELMSQPPAHSMSHNYPLVRGQK